MGKIAIKGNSQYGKEIIAFLIDIGGWIRESDVEANNSHTFYYLDNAGEITWGIPAKGYALMYWELLSVLYPFKLGDLVTVRQTSQEFRIEKMKWDSEQEAVLYSGSTCEDVWYTSQELGPVEVNELTAFISERNAKGHLVEGKVCAIDFNERHFLDKVELNLGEDFELKQEDGKWFVVKKKIEYPKTYEACWYLLKYDPNFDKVEGYKSATLSALQKLLVCRAAYWKVAGEEMGLDKPWEPDWKNGEQRKYCIFNDSNKIKKGNMCFGHAIFAFPTPEMQDAFKENFDRDLEFCKELL